MKLLTIILLSSVALVAQSAPLTTQQFCDGQSGAADALAPLITQLSQYVIPPDGKTPQDVFNYWDMSARLVLGEECVVMRLRDRLNTDEANIASVQGQVQVLQGQVQAFEGQVTALQNQPSQASALSISPVLITTTGTTATLQFNTAFQSVAQVKYGTTATVGPTNYTAFTTTFTANQSVTISGLSLSTAYNFWIILKDAAGNITTPPLKFTATTQAQ